MQVTDHFRGFAAGERFHVLPKPLLDPGRDFFAAVTLVYRVLKYGEEYVAQGMEEYEQAYRERAVKNPARKAKELGYKLLPTNELLPQVTPA